MSFTVSEKYAVSEPAIIADNNSSINITKINIVVLGAENVTARCNNSGIRAVSPSVLSKIILNFMIQFVCYLQNSR